MRHVALTIAFLLLVPLAARATDPLNESLAPLGALEESALSVTFARIHAIRAPLLARPAFTIPEGTFPAEVSLPADSAIDAMWLERGSETCDLVITPDGAGASVAWGDVPDLQVSFLELSIAEGCAPALYDLHLRYHGTMGQVEERQVHSVRVMDPARYAALADGSAQPRIVVIADPQIGDPRALVQDAQEDPTRIPATADGILGDGGASTNGRWKAARVAFAEARALDPDFVLVAGDLAFGQLVPGSYAVEFEEVARVLAAADVAMIVAPGNHDGYSSNGQDGYAYWHEYIGPLYTFMPTVPGTHVLVMNTYDWSDLDRIGVSYGVSAWGGQVRADQLAWIDSTLARYRIADPDGRLLTLSHHSPSWRQDPWSPRAEGIPGAEQVERGALTYTSTDQGWIGENRLPLRDLLRQNDVEVAFAGHTHHDRVARDDGEGGIVGSMQTMKVVPADFDPRILHHWDRSDIILMGESQADLMEAVRTPTGPLYVDTTTPMSDSDEYWGYRSVEFSYGEDGRLDLTRFGYAMTQEELDAIALHPEHFNVEHASIGLFSTPIRLQPGSPWTLVPT